MAGLRAFCCAPISEVQPRLRRSPHVNYATFPLKSASRERDSFVNATLDTGPAAVPYLIKAIRAQNSSLQRSSWYAKFWAWLPSSARARLPGPVRGAGTIPALAYTLALLGPAARDAIPVLSSTSDDRVSEVRYFSVWTLGQTRVPEARSAISRHLNDRVWQVREQARRALEEIAFYGKQKN